MVKPGQTYTFTARQLNWHQTRVTDTPPIHIERSIGDTAYVYQFARKESAYTSALANLGVKWNLVPPTGKTWDEVEHTRSTVTVKCSYVLSVRGSAATARIYDSVQYYAQDWAGTFGGITHPDTVVKTKTLTFEGYGGQPYDPFWIDNMRDGFSLGAAAGLGPTDTPVSAFALVTVYSITISFPQTPG